MTTTHADALVVGGGPAGLSAAVYLARYLRSVVVLDSGRGRSSHQQVNHNYLGFPEGVSARELRRLGRAQLARYPHAQVIGDHVEHAIREDDGTLTARTGRGAWHARVVVLATGVVDHYPAFEGCESYVGTSLFWCIACDGYENRSRDLVVVGNDDRAAAEALQLRSLTPRVRVVTNNGEDRISETFRRRLDDAGVAVIHDHLVGAEGEGGQLRHLLTAAGERLAQDAMFSLQGATPETDVARALGVALDDDGYVLVDTEQKTSVPGVYAAGDLTSLHAHQVAAAVHEGAQAACAANYFLQPPEVKPA